MSPVPFAAAVAALSLVAPVQGFVHAARGPGGGAVWAGRFPNTLAPWDRRQSAIYLPPGYDPGRRYPVVYLLHAERGHFWRATLPSALEYADAGFSRSSAR